MAAKRICTPVTSDGFSGSACRLGNYGASSQSCCERVSMSPFNCPPLLLTSSGTSQLLSNMLDNCLWWSSGMSGQMSRTVAPVSIRTPITFGKASRTLEQQRTNTSGTAKLLLLSSILFHYVCFVLYFGCCPPTTSITSQTLNLNVEKALSIVFGSGGSFFLSDRKMLLLLLRIEQRDFS